MWKVYNSLVGKFMGRERLTDVRVDGEREKVKCPGRFTSEQRVRGTHWSRSVHGGEGKDLCPCLEWNPGRPARSLVILLMS